MDLQKILYATVKSFEMMERMRRDDITFDGFEFLALRIGLKNPSSLRKMCEPRSDANKTKLGFDDALLIMQTTGDYRLLNYLVAELKRSPNPYSNQFDLFCQPMRSLTDAATGEQKEEKP